MCTRTCKSAHPLHAAANPYRNTRNLVEVAEPWPGVPVEFNVTGVALTKNPVSPDTPHADGTPAVRDTVPLGMNVNA